jgi:hypothetical protein
MSMREYQTAQLIQVVVDVGVGEREVMVAVRGD